MLAVSALVISLMATADPAAGIKRPCSPTIDPAIESLIRASGIDEQLKTLSEGMIAALASGVDSKGAERVSKAFARVHLEAIVTREICSHLADRAVRSSAVFSSCMQMPLMSRRSTGPTSAAQRLREGATQRG